MVSASRLREIALEWISKMNQRSIPEVLALYADDAVHCSPNLRRARPETEGRIVGKSKLSNWWSDAFAATEGIQYEVRFIMVLPEAGLVTVQYERTTKGQPSMLVVEVFYINEAGLITQSHVFLG